MASIGSTALPDDWESSFYKLTPLSENQVEVFMETRTDKQITLKSTQPGFQKTMLSAPVLISGASQTRLVKSQSQSQPNSLSTSLSHSAEYRTAPVQPRPFPSPPSRVLKKEAKPGWPSLDLSRNMFDYLSPSRLLGPRPDSTKTIDTHNLRNPMLLYRKRSNINNEEVYEEIYRITSTKHVPPPRSKSTSSGITVQRSPSHGTVSSANSTLTHSQIRSIYRKNTLLSSLQSDAGKEFASADDGAARPIPQIKKGSKNEKNSQKSAQKQAKIEEDAIKKQIKEQFSKYDLNGDGHISRREALILLRKVVESAMPEMKDSEVVSLLDYVLAKMDTNKDQHIEYPEYEKCVLEDPLLRGCFGNDAIWK